MSACSFWNTAVCICSDQILFGCRVLVFNVSLKARYLFCNLEHGLAFYRREDRFYGERHSCFLLWKEWDRRKMMLL